MGKITSTLELQDGYARTIDNAVNSMNRLTGTIDTLNHTLIMPNIDRPFSDIRAGAGVADTSVDRLTSSVDQLVRGMTELQMSSRLDNVDNGFEAVRSEITRTNEQLDKLNNNLQQTSNHSSSVGSVTSGFGGMSRAILVVNNGLQLMQTTLQGIGQFGDKADQRISVDSRIGLINDGLQTQAQLEAKVMAAANATRTEYTATAALVASMGRQDYFAGNNEKAIQFASTVNKGLVVSGATAAEASGAITQLTQGLASGVLRGDEFNSIMENAPILAEMMTQSMDVTKGKLREMAEEGMLTTDVVVSSIMAQAATLDQQFSSMPMTFGQATTILGNDVSQMMDYLSQPGQAVDIFIQKVEELTAYLNTPQGVGMMDNVAAGLTTAANVLSWFFTLGVNTYQFFADNWSWIGPIFWGIAAAIGIATTATLIYNGVMAAANLIEAWSIASKAIHAGSSIAEAAALQTATGAQVGFNTALLASPITWIIAAVILLIVVIYAVVGAINQVTGTSISATGVICGVFAAAGAFVGNIFIGAYNLIMDGIALAYNAHAMLAEFLANVFIDPLGSVVRLFGGMASAVLGILGGIASAMDTLFGSNLADTVSGWQDNLQGWTDSVAGEAKIQVPRMDASSMHLQRLNYGDAYGAGYNVGQGIDNKVSSLFGNVESLSDQLANLNQSLSGTTGAGKDQDFGSAYKNPTGGTIDKIGKIGSAVDISDQSLQYLNDIASIAALNELDSYQTLTYEQANDLKLSQQDADALRRSAGSSTNIYYLNYSGGGVQIKNDIKKGEDWETIKARIHDETESELETGFSGIDEVVYG